MDRRACIEARPACSLCVRRRYNTCEGDSREQRKKKLTSRHTQLLFHTALDLRIIGPFIAPPSDPNRPRRCVDVLHDPQGRQRIARPCRETGLRPRA